METKTDMPEGVVLRGLDGGNPLGFLAAVGVVAAMHHAHPGVRIGWTETGNGWCPELTGYGNGEDEFLQALKDVLEGSSMAAFDVDKGMPCKADKFEQALKQAQADSSPEDRRVADFLAAFGTEMYPDEKSGLHQGSLFRMVRSGDSAGQGLPFYAKQIRTATGLDHLRRVLFHTWDYKDEGFSLRWDPIEDQRYALTWKNPSEAKAGDAPGTMLAANCLAVEALQLFPTPLVGRKVQTTGFVQAGKRELWFVWPIWRPKIGVETLRSLLTSPEVRRDPPDRQALSRMGVTEVYGSQRIKQSMYYSNFSPSLPR